MRNNTSLIVLSNIKAHCSRFFSINTTGILRKRMACVFSRILTKPCLQVNAQLSLCE